MFLTSTVRRNRPLIDIAFKMHQEGKVMPDTFIVDVDTFIHNAKLIKQEADRSGIQLFFMLKQMGRNPYLAKKLIEIGYEGAVTVDYKEAEVMMKHQIPICNVGHLVQPPSRAIQKLVSYGCRYMTVYSLEKMRQINEAAVRAERIQDLLIRVVGEDDLIYSGQTAGFTLDSLQSVIDELKILKNIRIAGVTSFPCFLFDEKTNDIQPTANLQTVLNAKSLLEERGFTDIHVNAPSTTSVDTLLKMKVYDIDSGEPGHGLSGTTPLQAVRDTPEIPCVVYLSEISHNFQGNSYCFGGGYYRRGHIENALVGSSLSQSEQRKVILPNLDSIDYHFGIDREENVGDTVIMAYRFQMFVTRSDICLVEGLSNGKPRIVGVFNGLGDEVK